MLNTTSGDIEKTTISVGCTTEKIKDMFPKTHRIFSDNKQSERISVKLQIRLV